MKDYFTVHELAEYIKISKSTIYKKTMSKSIPHMKTGKNLLFAKEAIDKWLQGFIQPTLDEVRADISSILKRESNEK